MRFFIDEKHPKSHMNVGIFSVAYEILDDTETEEYIRLNIRETLNWFTEHLKVPELDDPRAIYWFKDSESKCIENIWKLVTFLRLSGKVVSHIRMPQAKIGYILYEDDKQIAAIPFKDTRRVI